jgi:uncharacterized protein YegP (UPF0339 family)
VVGWKAILPRSERGAGRGEQQIQMPGKFEIKRAKNGEYYFNLLASNNEIILTSETYKAKASAKNGIESVKRNSQLDERFVRKEGKSGKPFFVLKARNHEVIGRSESYESERARENGITSVRNNAPAAKIDDLSK